MITQRELNILRAAELRGGIIREGEFLAPEAFAALIRKGMLTLETGVEAIYTMTEQAYAFMRNLSHR